MSTKYIPPSRRAEISSKEVNTQSIDASDTTLFPSLGMNKVSSKTWGSKASYKTTIHNLIAYEKLTEQEKNVEAERAKTMEGWSVLYLELTKERLNEIHDKNMEREEELENVYQDGGFYIYVPKVDISHKRVQMIIDDDEDDDASNNESAEESEYVTED